MTSKPTLLRFKFDDFESLPHAPGDCTLSEKVKGKKGRSWKLKLYPGGRKFTGDGRLGVYLSQDGGSDTYATIEFIVRDAGGRIYHYEPDDEVDHYEAYGKTFGSPRMLERSAIIDRANNILHDGKLVIDIVLQEVCTPQSYAPNHHATSMMKLLDSGDDADVSFKVQGTLFRAHELILKANAPVLRSFCTEHKKRSPVPIRDTSPELFRTMLRFVYGGDASEALSLLKLGWKTVASDVVPPPSERARVGKDIIDAADRYGIVSLKLAVETALVERCILNLDNVVDWLLFADAKTCPLLMEHATNYMAVMIKDILSHESSEKLKESPKLMADLMLAVSSVHNAHDCFDETSKLGVRELRAKLNEKGLDVDGSKEMLVSRLNNASNKRRRTQ